MTSAAKPEVDNVLQRRRLEISIPHYCELALSVSLMNTKLIGTFNWH